MELQTIELKEFAIERLQFVKDLFIFSCYTGLAYTDTISLTPANIIRGIDGDFWLITNRQKTGTSVKIPLLPKAIEMIEKYKCSPKSIADGSLFPRISNQRLNGYLKEMADLCGIDKNLTFHLARHTFATTVTLSNGVPIESVSKMLGHTKITTTQVYAKVIERKLSNDMQLLKQKLSEKPDSAVKNLG
jgi:site-specific recombinase XerD